MSYTHDDLVNLLNTYPFVKPVNEESGKRQQVLKSIVLDMYQRMLICEKHVIELAKEAMLHRKVLESQVAAPEAPAEETAVENDEAAAAKQREAALKARGIQVAGNDASTAPSSPPPMGKADKTVVMQNGKPVEVSAPTATSTVVVPTA